MTELEKKMYDAIWNAFRTNIHNPEQAAIDCAQIAREHGETKWIDVNEQKPRSYDDVLMVDDKGNIGVSYFDSKGRADMYHFSYGSKITHWQTIPAPPPHEMRKD